ncbi:MAG: hypothetical protein HY042_02165, partial [Spirochaetia bacterium]|nr:hypothetical protein [Spirochaetia bacterium]
MNTVKRIVVSLTACIGMTCLKPSLIDGERADTAHQAILERYPPGTRIETVTQALENDGFTCAYQEGEFVGMKGRARYLYCDRSNGLLVSRRWQIAVVPEGALVKE